MGENRGRNLTYRQKNGFLKGRISHHKIRKLKTAKYIKIIKIVCIMEQNINKYIQLWRKNKQKST
mgnify:CR=1 FL=1